jgi:hypothetical protein
MAKNQQVACSQHMHMNPEINLKKNSFFYYYSIFLIPH